MSANKNALIGACCLALLAAHTAYGQTDPSLDSRLRQNAQRDPFSGAATATTRTGDSDIVLLRRNSLFTFSGSLYGSPTSNAFLSSDETKSDQFLTFNPTLSVATRIADKVDAFADLGIQAVRYSKYSELDYSAFTGSLGAAMKYRGVAMTLAYRPAAIYDNSFKNRQLLQHRLQLTASYPLMVGRFLLQPGLQVERAFASPEEYKNWAVGGQAIVSTTLSQRRGVLAFARAGFERRKYDDYFSSLLGTDRIDKRWDGSVGLQWNATRRIAVNAQYSFERNRSTSDVNGFKASTGVIGFTMQTRF